MQIWLIWMTLAGYGCWLLSDILEWLTGDYGSTVVYLTALFHLLAGIGIWGLASALATKDSRLFWFCSLLMSIGHLSLVALPLHVHWSGLGSRLVIGAHPVYLIPLLMWSVGALLFSAQLIRSNRQSAWIGWGLAVGFTLLILSRPMNWSMSTINLITIAVSIVLIKLCYQCLRAATPRFPGHPGPAGT